MRPRINQQISRSDVINILKGGIHVDDRLLVNKSLPTLRLSRDYKNTVPIKVRIHQDLYGALCYTEEGRVNSETLRLRASAHMKLAFYLDQYRRMVTESNIKHIVDSDYEISWSDREKVSRSFTLLQLEVNDEIQRLLKLSHYLKYGDDFQFVVDNPLS